MPELISATKAAEHLGVSESFIRKRIKSGDLPARKMRGKWGISEDDLADLVVPADDDSPDRSSARSSDPTDSSARSSVRSHGDSSARSSEPGEWRDDLLAQVARLEADKATLREDMGLRIEASKARVIDLESAATVREGRIADMEATHADVLSTRDAHMEELRGQVASLEAELRDSHSRAEANALGWATRADELSHRIADLVDKHQQANKRVYELEPVAEQVPMLQAAVDEKDATLTGIQDDLEAIASRPVTGPVFRLLTKGKLRR